MSYLSGVSGISIRVEQTAPRIQVRATAIQPGAAQYICIRTVSSQHSWFALLNLFKLIYGPFGQSKFTEHFISAQFPDKPRRNQIYQRKRVAKVLLSNLYTVSTTQIFSWRSSQKPKIFFSSFVMMITSSSALGMDKH